MRYLSPSRKDIISLLAVLTFWILLTPASMAQRASLGVNSASISINPTGSDSYTLQGTISGLNLTGASYVGLSVGNFGASIPLSSFTQQPGNVFTYKDTTGLAPNWVSSLTIDLNAHTFKAQANSLVLAGLTNPFAVQLGTDQGAACTMVRVQQASPGSYQLTPADPVGMTCQISNAPVASPNVLAAGTATNVNIEVSAVQVTANDSPQNIQLFRADDNAQPTGDPLCTLGQQPAGDYSCTVSFNEANSGMIPLLLQATVAGQPILSPGLALQVAAAATNDSAQQILNIQNAMVQAWQNFAQNGDTTYARMQSLMALRKVLAPPVALTGTPLGLAPDQESIYVRSSAGLSIILASDDVQEVLGGASSGQTGNAVAAHQEAAPTLRTFLPHVETAEKPHGIIREPVDMSGHTALACNSPMRDIVWNNKVLVWSPGDVFFGKVNTYQKIVDVLQKSKCPSFDVNNTDDIGYQATVASLQDFARYGTIIINTHGTVDPQGKVVMLTGEKAPTTIPNILAYFNTVTGGGAVYFNLGIACLPLGCFQLVYPTNPNIQATANTIIYASFCHSLEGGQFGFAPALAPSGGNSAYYGFIGIAFAQADAKYGVPLFDALVNQYENAGDAYGDALAGTPFAPLILSGSAIPAAANIGGSGSSAANRAAPRGVVFQPNPSGVYFGLWNNSNLGYVGNPKLMKTDPDPPVPGSQGLAAYLEGASSCGMNGAPYVNVNWTNHATRNKGGILETLTNLVRGDPNDFTNEATETPPDSTPGTLVSDWSLAKWTPLPELPGSADDIVADFLPDPGNPIAARACLVVPGVAGLFLAGQLATVWDDQQPAQRGYETALIPPKKMTQSYMVPLYDAGNYTSKGAAASISITSTGKDSWRVTVTAGAADPNYNVVNPGPGDGPFYGLAQLILIAVNPGAEGSAMVQVDGQINNAPFMETVGTRTLVTAAGGTILVSDGQGKALVKGSLNPDDSNAAETSFSVMADSSCSGIVQTIPQCGAAITVSLGEDLVAAPDPATFSVTLNIQFVNQQQSGHAAVRH